MADMTDAIAPYAPTGSTFQAHERERNAWLIGEVYPRVLRALNLCMPGERRRIAQALVAFASEPDEAPRPIHSPETSDG